MKLAVIILWSISAFPTFQINNDSIYMMATVDGDNAGFPRLPFHHETGLA